jgi:TolA-binding protein
MSSRIKDCLLEGAPAALRAKIYAIEGVVTSRIENLSGRIEELANAYQESTEKDRQMYLLVEEMRQELQKMNPVHDALQNNNVQQQSQPTSPVPEHPLVSRLKGLCKKTGRDKSCRVKLEIAAPDGRFHVPREIATSEEPEPPADRGKVVKGSFEVDNDSRVRLTIDVDFGEKRLFFLRTLS